MKRYNPKEIEPKWQKTWAETGVYKAVDFDERPKYVMLTEFPYPSGAGIHIGHSREYTLGDILARHKRMLGFNVLFPMGYDAFGLPTENYAIKNKMSPQKATDDNIAIFQSQLEALGFGFDWTRSFRTSDPAYYKWTQWLFLQFFKKGLAYQAEIAINWCPFCKTGLANEEVINGRHERCDTPVEKKLLKQWLLKITAYADRLIDGLSSVDYPRPIADQQINWIGRSKGAEIDFMIDGSEHRLTVFTTRPDTLFGVTFMVLAPEHPLLDTITTDEYRDQVNSYIKTTQSKTELEREEGAGQEKTGVFTGSYANNPVNNQKIPIWVGDYVLMGYGTGAIMAVPAHDERDNDFANKFNLPVRQVIEPDKAEDHSEAVTDDRAYVDLHEGRIINSGNYDGMAASDMRERLLADLKATGNAREQVHYKLRDWIFSRQHYWGEPIPIIHCPEHGSIAVPDDQLPVELPPVDYYEPTDNGESPLSVIETWVNTTCPVCGQPAKRETDTMPNWAGSSWYYLRYFDAHNDKAFADRSKLDYWGAVDLYLGGMEHTTLHLLYSRFWHQFLYDQGLVPTPEPYLARRGQGIILAADGTKMSKSKGNIVDPIDIIDSGYGADATRLAMAFIAPYDQATPWSPESVAGTYRFLNRVWILVQEFLESDQSGNETGSTSQAVQPIIHRLIKTISEDLTKLNFNTAVAAQMETVNELYKLKEQDHFIGRESWQFAIESLLQLLSPFAPHLSEELWQQLGHSGSIHTSQWPSYDEKYLIRDSATIVVQINGKLRARLTLPVDVTEEQAANAAKTEPKIIEHLAGREIKKTIYVPGRLVNLVV
jgi:leucyl-tRNA synthetase